MLQIKEDVLAYVRETYHVDIEYLWKKSPGNGIFRHADNRKWFAALLIATKKSLELSEEGDLDLLNVKVGDAYLLDTLAGQEGFFRGYHMSKGHWLSIALDGTVPLSTICRLIDESFLLTASKAKQQKLRPPRDWLIPANPKYYDIEHAFDDTDVINWKQGRGVNVKDTVYMYVASPVSAILYKTTVIETDIPYRYTDTNLDIKALMRIRLEKRYAPEEFPLETLKEYGVSTIRGPRGIPERLKEKLS
uniref:MmcQ/YjbR family DNA-binding protein n=1 Tax=Eubacterium cellulosolvens TaxID=29322 RepID=UPI0004806F24|nr:MmcQ/YjbR family DNA-binding protein [[Eubacterium] cellulosolvens]